MLSLSRRIASASPGSTVVLFQAGFSRELEMTYVGTSLKYVAIGSSVLSGQYVDHSSYSLRPADIVPLLPGTVGTHRRGSGR